MTFSPNIDRLEPSATIRVSSLAKELRARGRSIIDLSAGEPDFPTPGWIRDAAVTAVNDGATRYTPTPGLPELRSAIAREVGRRSGREIEPESIVVSCGAKHALFNACFTLFGPGDDVLVASPYWTSYPQIVGLARARPVFVSGPPERSFRLSPRELDGAVTPETRGLILCTPSNPTGAVYSPDELRAVAEWAAGRDVVLISDEIYHRIHFGEGREAPGILDLPPDVTGSVVLVDGMSKAYAMTGWRVGFACADPAVAGQMAALQSHVTSNPATPSQHAALAALDDRERADAAVEEMRSAFLRRRDRVLELFGERLPGVEAVEPRGAFYLFFRIDGFFDEARPDSTELCSWILQEAGVAIVPGAAFGDDRYARLSFAASDEALEEGVERMAGLLVDGAPGSA